MITHIVIFRTKCDEHKKIVLEMARNLKEIETIDSFICGEPIVSDRAVVDDTFAVGLIVTFKTAQDMAIYASHPIHLDFNENCLAKYKVKVQVFDIAE